MPWNILATRNPAQLYRPEHSRTHHFDCHSPRARCSATGKQRSIFWHVERVPIVHCESDRERRINAFRRQRAAVQGLRRELHLRSPRAGTPRRNGAPQRTAPLHHLPPGGEDEERRPHALRRTAGRRKRPSGRPRARRFSWRPSRPRRPWPRRTGRLLWTASLIPGDLRRVQEGDGRAV